LTATERTAGFFLMKKLPKGKNAKDLAKELFFLLLPYKQCVLSITSDNGSDFTGTNVSLNILTQTFFLLTHIPTGKED
jgi:IS30 family transposase